MSAHNDHDDFGGLHRDLLAIGTVMGRRGLLRIAARLGLGARTLQLLGCGSGPTGPHRVRQPVAVLRALRDFA